MEFEWDEAKNRKNIRKHGFDFSDAEVIFQSPVLSWEDNRKNYGEKRFVSLGVFSDLILHITYTERNGKIRIISIRKANKNERKIYKERL